MYYILLCSVRYLSLQVIGRKVIEIRIFLLSIMYLSFPGRKSSAFSETLRLLPTVTSRNWEKATLEREWSCNGEDSLSFFTFWELMEFLRRGFAYGRARRYVQLLCYRSMATVVWKIAWKTFFRGFTVCCFFTIAMEVDENNGLGSVEATRLHREGKQCDYLRLYLLRKMKYCCKKCRIVVSALGKIYNSGLLLAGWKQLAWDMSCELHVCTPLKKTALSKCS